MAHFTLPTGQRSGPLLNASVGVSTLREEALKAANQAVPNRVDVRALVDTGASNTCVDPTVLNQLQLSPTGSTQVHTPSSGGTPDTKNQFDVSLLIPGSDVRHFPLVLPVIPVLEAEILDMQGFAVLIGRDILEDCVLVYNGPMGQFTLAF